jgi:hypothetical protein
MRQRSFCINWRQVVLFGVIISFAQASGTFTATPTVVKADIFFTPWYVLTRHAWSVAEAREAAYVRVTIRESSYAAIFGRWLALDKMTKVNGDPARADARVVIDLTLVDGAKATVYADRFTLVSEDGSQSRPLDDQFWETVCSLAVNPKVFGMKPCQWPGAGASNYRLKPTDPRVTPLAEERKRRATRPAA